MQVQNFLTEGSEDHFWSLYFHVNSKSNFPGGKPLVIGMHFQSNIINFLNDTHFSISLLLTFYLQVNTLTKSNVTILFNFLYMNAE